jgi:hypothetical protein
MLLGVLMKELMPPPAVSSATIFEPAHSSLILSYVIIMKLPVWLTHTGIRKKLDRARPTAMRLG